MRISQNQVSRIQVHDPSTDSRYGYLPPLLPQFLIVLILVSALPDTLASIVTQIGKESN